MKNLIRVIQIGFLVFSVNVLSFSQEVKRSGSNYIKGNILYPRTELDQLVQGNADAIYYLKKAKRERLQANILAGIGGVSLGIGVIPTIIGIRGKGFDNFGPLLFGLGAFTVGGLMEISAWTYFKLSNRNFIKTIDIFTKEPIGGADIQDKLDVSLKDTSNGVGLIYIYSRSNT